MTISHEHQRRITALLANFARSSFPRLQDSYLLHAYHLPTHNHELLPLHLRLLSGQLSQTSDIDHNHLHTELNSKEVSSRPGTCQSSISRCSFIGTSTPLLPPGSLTVPRSRPLHLSSSHSLSIAFEPPHHFTSLAWPLHLTSPA